MDESNEHKSCSSTSDFTKIYQSVDAVIDGRAAAGGKTKYSLCIFLYFFKGNVTSSDTERAIIGGKVNGKQSSNV